MAVVAVTSAAAAAALHGQSGASDIVLRAAAAKTVTGAWTLKADTAASGGTALWLPDAGVPKIVTAAASPQNSFELGFFAKAGVGYRLWMRGRAQGDAWTNDSAFVQFSGSVSSTGTPVFRIGSTDATVVSLEECSGCGVSGWGWSDNGYGGYGPLIYFGADGAQTLRVQGREDGFTIDQIVLSPEKYLVSAPGAAKQDTTILPVSDGSGPSPGSITLVRGPYLQRPSASSMTVVWATREPGTAEVRYNVPGGTLSSLATSRLFSASVTALPYDYYQHEATIAGLTPGSTYAYQPFVSGIAAAPVSAFETAAKTGEGSVSFVAFGDSGTGSLEQRQLADLMDRENIDLALHLGDIAYGSASLWGDATYDRYQEWFFDIYKWLPRIPFMPAEGNHDSSASNGYGRAYLDLFVLPENGAQRERYYSFDHGPVHFVVLDTEFAFQDATRRAEQVAWLESDLAATRQPWKIAAYHRSPYSSGTDHGSDLVVRAAFSPLFERYGVDLSLSSHDHDYERSVPIRQSTTPTDRPVTYIVSGGGGAALYQVGSSWWTAFSRSRHHYMRVRADTCTLTVEAVGTDGSVFDRASQNRCGTATAQEVVLHTISAATRAGRWTAVTNTSAASGGYLTEPDASIPKIETAAAAPASYFDMTFTATAGVPYRLWLRGRAQNDYWGNDSVFVQFSGSASSTGTAQWRIGTTDATKVVLEDCGGCGEAGWGWQDNGYGTGVLGPLVYFATSGPQTIRIQSREDGYGIDQIVLSPARYLNVSPGALKNDTVILTPSGGQ